MDGIDSNSKHPGKLELFEIRNRYFRYAGTLGNHRYSQIIGTSPDIGSINEEIWELNGMKHFL